MRRRNFVAGTLVAGLAGCLGFGNDSEGGTVTELSDSGDHTESGLELDPGLTTVESNYEGPRGFVVKLVDEGGSETTFAFHVGEYAGETASLMDGGEYSLRVESEGPWDVTVRQPRAEEGEALPDSLSDDKSAVYGPYEFTGSYEVTGTHSGSGEFGARIYPQTNESATLLFQDLGDFEGETTVEYEGVGWIAVKAAGDWTLDFQ